MKRLIGYYRVSTKRQGESGLGLEGQQAAVEQFAKQHSATIVATYTEVESGKRSDRPQLAKALAHAKRSKATLCVAKLDRLSRNAAFLLTLLEGKAPFVACDNPHANELTIGVLAVVAQAEARAISERTKAALAAYKRRGGKLGTNNLTDAGRKRGARRAGLVSKRQAQEAYSDLLPTMLECRAAGMSQRAIADRLNHDGHTTRRGRPWNQVQVMHVLKRA